jgi:hypothetical protein
MDEARASKQNKQRRGQVRARTLERVLVDEMQLEAVHRVAGAGSLSRT